MSVIMNFKEKKREKQIKYERKVLKDISLEQLKKRFSQVFGSSNFSSIFVMNTGIEEACFDVAIEAYVLGAKYSRFGYFGEPIESVRGRCFQEEKHLIDTLYNFILYWSSLGDEQMVSESLYYLCEKYIDTWWLEGFRNGERRYKLRLH